MIKIISKVILVILLVLISLGTEQSGVLAVIQPTEVDTEILIQAELTFAKEKETEILVQYKPGARDRKGLFSADRSLLVKKAVRTGPDSLIVSPQKGVDSRKVIEELRKDDSVIHIESNIKRIAHTAPNDPGYTKQWGLKTIKAETAWTDMPASKKGVIVAVIDSGLELNHSDLQASVMPGGYNFISGSGDIYDVNGHGTAVSGVIAAEMNNGLGIAGVVGMADVRILPLQVANYAGESYVSDVIRAIDYAINNGADVINLSLGSNSYSVLENKAVQRAIQAGVMVVASAGNDGNSGYCFPASYDNVISVGAIDKAENVSKFSNVNDKIDVVAPGEDIYSCGLYNSYRKYSGTSFSAPMVTGIVAVLRAIEPSIQPNEVAHILEMSAQDRGEIGRDNLYGYGVVDMKEAIVQVCKETVESEDFKGVLWVNQDQVPTDKQWRIVFNAPLDDNGIPEGTICVIDEGRAYPIEMMIGNLRNEVSISPKEPYQLGKTYYLVISDQIFSKSGKSLANAVKMKFTIQTN